MNITLSVDESVLRTVRVYAAQRGSSVNALVREFLAGIATREDQVSRARERILELSGQSTARVGSRSWSRDDLHAR
ncbi:MAG: hypothetical protein OXE58_11570 [Acidobacteria bacterium]|nr:hypothetical protein [Acidobacteriota bacterium]